MLDGESDGGMNDRLKLCVSSMGSADAKCYLLHVRQPLQMSQASLTCYESEFQTIS